MPQKSPWHSVRPSAHNVHHDNTACTEGNNIEPQYLRSGTGNRPKCERCQRLDAEGK